MIITIETRSKPAYVRLWQLSKQGRPCNNGLLLSGIAATTTARKRREQRREAERDSVLRPSPADDNVFRDSWTRQLITNQPRAWPADRPLLRNAFIVVQYSWCSLGDSRKVRLSVAADRPLLRIGVFIVAVQIWVPGIDDNELWRNDLTSTPRGVSLRKMYYSKLR